MNLYIFCFMVLVIVINFVNGAHIIINGGDAMDFDFDDIDLDKILSGISDSDGFYSYSSRTSCTNGVCTSTVCKNGVCTTDPSDTVNYGSGLDYSSEEYGTTEEPATSAPPTPAPAPPSPAVSKDFQCGDYANPTKKFNTKIVGGETANRNGWPWMVSLQYNGRHFCAGSLVRVSTQQQQTDIVITAAHCVRGKGSAFFDRCVAKAGEHDITEKDSTEQRSGFKGVYTHSDYKPRNGYGNDIALIVLDKPFKFTTGVRPVCLPKTTAAAGQTMYALGWGDSREGGALTDRLKQVKVPLVSDADCHKVYWDVHDNDEMICAGYQRGGAGTCQGDSGGPLVSERNGRYFQQGITSFGEGCAREGKPGVYTRMSHYCDWIEHNVCKYSEITGSCDIKLCQ